MLKLNKSELNRLMKFQGYGNLKGPVWFLGIEEKLPDKSNRNRELKKRLLFDPLMDLAKAQKILGREIPNAKTKTWNWMSKFALGLLHPAYDWKDTATTRFYKSEHLGRSNGETFLTELFPLPARSSKTTPYLEKYRKREDYERQVLPIRIQWLKSALKRYKPRYVIVYGASSKYRRLVIENLGDHLVKEARCGKLYLYKTTKILLFSFFTRGLSHNQASTAIRLLNDDRDRVKNLGCLETGQGLISDDLLNRIQAGADITRIIKRYVHLTRVGRNLRGLCPFHQEKSPSFTVSPSRQIFNCFGCGADGNVFAFLMRITGSSFHKIIRDLGRKMGVDTPVLALRG